MANLWTTSNNHLLATLDEGIPLAPGDLTLPISPAAGLQISLISGTLPNGLSIDDFNIIGTPDEVTRTLEYTFVLRALISGAIQDRTFRIIVQGADKPVWQTKRGLLGIGPNDAEYILDSEPVDFQLDVTDTDLFAGDSLLFYIAPGDGVLPPGLTLSDDGRITGVITPETALSGAIDGGTPQTAGAYDASPYDVVQLDFDDDTPLIISYDALPFDSIGYDQGIQYVIRPWYDNRYFEFAVTVADSTALSVKRHFKIHVLSDDYIKVDNVNLTVDNEYIRADATNIRTPVWLTPSNLGTVRANNNVTIYLDTLDISTLDGVITYELEVENPDGSPSILPPGTTLDSISGEITGTLPSQAAITKEYKFTVLATRTTASYSPIQARTFTISVIGDADSTITWITPSNLGEVSTGVDSILQVVATTSVTDSAVTYSLTGGSLPSGLRLLYSGEIVGRADTLVPVQQYNFEITAKDRLGVSATARNFSLTVNNHNELEYTDMYLRPLMHKELRKEFSAIINNPEIIPELAVYRSNDPKFGIPSDIKILLFAGIEKKSIREFFIATEDHFKRKQYRVGEVRKAVATKPGTNDPVYELVYIEVIDPADALTGIVRSQLTMPNGNIRKISNISNMRNAIEDVGQVNVNSQPLWMQENTRTDDKDTGYIAAIPLVFCKPGTADDILLNIQNAEQDGKINFSALDLDIDRAIVTGTQNNDDDQYVIFSNKSNII